MKLTKFGTLSEVDGVLVVDGFSFEGNSYNTGVDALLCIRDYLTDAIVEVAAKLDDHPHRVLHG